MSARFNRRRFLMLSAMAAAGSVVACAPQAPRVATKPTDAPAAAPAAATSAPAAAAPKPAATTPPLAVAQPTQIAAPAVAGRSYKEAPSLAQLVKDGKLPPVEKRLPDNPRVLKPLEETGQYGGTWRRAFRGLTDYLAPGKLMEARLIAWDAPDINTLRVIPNVIEKWEQNKDATEFTFYLRKGIKWSDGTDASTEDVKFWWEDIQLNADLTPQPQDSIRQRIGGEFKMATLSVVDNSTWKVKYAASYPLLPIYIAKSGGNANGHMNVIYPAFMAPRGYLQKFLPKYGNKADLDKLAQDKKLQSWVDLWGKGGQTDGPIGSFMLNPDLPVMTAWKPERVLPDDPIRMSRNPYFWQVDDQGNQLPYIDSVEHSLYENAEVFKLWLAQGKIDLQQRNVDIGAYTFFKENESKGDYRVLQWRSASTETYFPNQNTPDPVLADLFAKPDFREALNVAINRKEIAEVVFNGLTKARQYSPVNGSPEFDAEMEQRWTQYDPARANTLLDGLGLKKGPDGVRLRPDGQPLEVTVEHTTAPGSAVNDMHELVRRAWTAIGVKTSMKGIDRSLYTEHYRNGELEIGFWGWDRASVNKADPGRWLAYVDDGPWAPSFGHFYQQQPYKKEEPPAEHPIRKMWSLWEQVQREPDEAKGNALFMDIIKLHREAPVAVGVVGESASVWIVKNNMRNVKPGYINDDTLRDYGLINPPQFYLKK
ncbi:MAG TPA: ABC transporter substrate-binding protein [Chloroflexota bacterium]